MGGEGGRREGGWVGKGEGGGEGGRGEGECLTSNHAVNAADTETCLVQNTRNMTK